MVRGIRWYAYQAGVPVITSNHGGMAELVPHGVCGLHFRVNDPVDLRRTLKDLCRHPHQLARFRQQIPHVKDTDDHYAELIRFYEGVRARRASRLRNGHTRDTESRGAKRWVTTVRALCSNSLAFLTR